jgi:hypothetical protein
MCIISPELSGLASLGVVGIFFWGGGGPRLLVFFFFLFFASQARSLIFKILFFAFGFVWLLALNCFLGFFGFWVFFKFFLGGCWCVGLALPGCRRRSLGWGEAYVASFLSFFLDRRGGFFGVHTWPPSGEREREKERERVMLARSLTSPPLPSYGLQL